MKKFSSYILLIPIFVFLQSNILFSLPKCAGPESSWDRCYGTTKSSDEIYTGEFSNGFPKGMGLRIFLPDRTKQAGYFYRDSDGYLQGTYVYLMQYGLDYVWMEDSNQYSYVYSNYCQSINESCTANQLIPGLTKSFNNLSPSNREVIQRKLKN